jgi:hypothetical protein
MKLPELSLSGLTREYETIRDECIKLIRFFNPEWTFHGESDFGITLLELFAYIADNLHFYMDRLLNENFLTTCLRRSSAINLLHLIGYELEGKVAATVDLTFTLNQTTTATISIPKGTECQTAEGEIVYFETLKDVVIAPGELSVIVSAMEGRTDEEELGYSNGAPSQSFKFSSPDVIFNRTQDTVTILVANRRWSRVDSFAYSKAGDEHYILRRDEDHYLHVIFGDGTYGKIPPTNQLIKGIYREGGGGKGNVAAKTITVINDMPSLPSGITLTVNNESVATGGRDEEDLEYAKEMGPLTWKTRDSAVTLDDYSQLAMNISGVEKAKAYNPQLALIVVYIVPTGGGSTSSAFKENITATLSEKKIATDRIIVKDANYVKIDFSFLIHIFPNYRALDVKLNCEEAIRDFLKIENMNFGETKRPTGNVNYSDIIGLLEDIRGVDYIDCSLMTRRPEPTWIRRTGNASFSTIAISHTTVEETWEVFFLTATTFNVRGTVSGLQSRTGVLGTLFTADNNQISFTINPGSISMAAGDRATFKTSRQVWNVPIDDTEFPILGDLTINTTGGY